MRALEDRDEFKNYQAMKDIAKVLSVSKSGAHTFNKYNCAEITLLEGLGVEGDAHAGSTVKHRSRVAQNPDQPNLRQVHLIHNELFEALLANGFQVNPGQMGENITTTGVDLLALPLHAVLHIGPTAEIQITGLRNPCAQLDGIKEGLMKALIEKTSDGKLIRKAGVMGVVLRGGVVSPGDTIRVQLPSGPFVALDRV